MTNKAIYKKAAAEVVLFDNVDVVYTSTGCTAWSSQNGYTCHGNLEQSGGDLKPPLS